MVNAVLHMICGNCGSKDIYYCKDNNPEDDGAGNIVDCSCLHCDNCSTNHYLSEIPIKQKESDNAE